MSLNPPHFLKHCPLGLAAITGRKRRREKSRMWRGLMIFHRILFVVVGLGSCSVVCNGEERSGIGYNRVLA